ncbi:21801_t:CDS:2, partial [Racocetra persica]
MSNIQFITKDTYKDIREQFIKCFYDTQSELTIEQQYYEYDNNKSDKYKDNIEKLQEIIDEYKHVSNDRTFLFMFEIIDNFFTLFGNLFYETQETKYIQTLNFLENLFASDENDPNKQYMKEDPKEFETEIKFVKETFEWIVKNTYM